MKIMHTNAAYLTPEYLAKEAASRVGAATSGTISDRNPNGIQDIGRVIDSVRGTAEQLYELAGQISAQLFGPSPVNPSNKPVTPPSAGIFDATRTMMQDIHNVLLTTRDTLSRIQHNLNS